MLSNNFIVYGGKVILDTVTDIVYFPVWWYTRGTGLVAGKLLGYLSDKQKSLALWIWIKNLMRPMYGQYDWQGWLISFFMRLFQIIVRSIAMIFWFVLLTIIFCCWLVLPLFVLYQIIYQLHG